MSLSLSSIHLIMLFRMACFSGHSSVCVFFKQTSLFLFSIEICAINFRFSTFLVYQTESVLADICSSVLITLQKCFKPKLMLFFLLSIQQQQKKQLLDYLNGWVCFWTSIVVIGLLTAIIGDLSSHLGCSVGLKDTITAIAFVALGTSIPG